MLVILFAARGMARRAQEARREKASELRVEATRGQERARRAEVEAERERKAAEARAARADRVDPDTESPGVMGRSRGDREDEDERGGEPGHDADEAEGERRRPSFWERLRG